MCQDFWIFYGICRLTTRLIELAPPRRWQDSASCVHLCSTKIFCALKRGNCWSILSSQGVFGGCLLILSKRANWFLPLVLHGHHLASGTSVLYFPYQCAHADSDRMSKAWSRESELEWFWLAEICAHIVYSKKGFVAIVVVRLSRTTKSWEAGNLYVTLGAFFRPLYLRVFSSADETFNGSNSCRIRPILDNQSFREATACVQALLGEIS